MKKLLSLTLSLLLITSNCFAGYQSDKYISILTDLTGFKQRNSAGATFKEIGMGVNTSTGYTFLQSTADDPVYGYLPLTFWLGNTKMLSLGATGLATDRWLASDTNTILGVGAASAGTLDHSTGGGWNNTLFGNNVGTALTTGYNNTLLGRGFNGASGQALLSGNQNVLIGEAGRRLTTGYFNVVIGGLETGAALTTEYGMTLIGCAAGRYIANPGSAGSTLIGFNCGDAITTGVQETGIGYDCLGTLIDGDGNTGCGDDALYGLQHGTENAAFGSAAALWNKLGSYNAVLGAQAMRGTGNKSQNNNSIFGYQAGYAATDGFNNNIIMGYKAADNLTTGHDNIFIVYDTNAPATNTANYLNIGNAIYGTMGSLLYFSSPVSCANYFSTVATGTSPYSCTSTTVNTNLNADLWDGYQFSDYLNQAVKTTSSPTFAGLTDSGLTSGRIPYASTGGLLADSTNLQWDNTNQNFTVKSKSELATLGTTLIVNGDFATGDFTGWTAGASWNVVSTRAVHTAGDTLPLEQTVAGLKANTLYKIFFQQVTGAFGSGVTVSLGGTTYPVAVTSGVSRTLYILTVNTGNLIFTPSSTYTKGIDNVAVYEVIPAPATHTIYNSDGSIGYEVRAGGVSNKNLLLGANAGASSNGVENTLIGENAGRYVQASDMLCIGTNAGANATLAGASAYIGYASGQSCVDGAYNTGIGLATLSANISGSRNFAAGTWALYGSLNPYDCFAAGLQAMMYRTGNRTLALGGNVLAGNDFDATKTVDDTIAIGYNVGNLVGTGANRNIWIGASVATASGITATDGIIIGYNIQLPTTSTNYYLNIGNAITGDLSTGEIDIPLGDLKIQTVGKGLYVKEGTNACMGIATLVAGTVTVNTTKVTANSRIFLTVNGGTLTNVGATYISARTAGTSFTITSMNILDTSNVAWLIVEPSP